MAETSPGSPVAPSCWRLRTFANPTELSDFAVKARKDLDLREFQHDIEWLDIQRDPSCEELVVIADGSQTLTGMLASRVARVKFEYAIGGRVLLRRKLKQYTFHQGPVTTRSQAAEDVERGLVALHKAMESGAVAYFSSVPVDSEFGKSLSDPHSGVRKRFYVLPWGNENLHFRIRWNGDVASYLASLSPKKRGNVKRASQKLKSSLPHEVKKFHGPADIEGFLRDGVVISDRTYQSQEFGLGLVSNAGREALMRFAAARDAFYGYILYLNGVPAAFRYGFVYGQTYFAISTGYDPQWSAAAPGAVLFMETLNDLAASRVPVSMIDLLPHVTPFKSDRANEVHATRNYYLIQRSLQGFALYAPIFLLERMKILVASALKAFKK